MIFSDNVIVNKILTYICVFLSLIIVLPLHEFAHAYVAYKCGDNTPKIYNRLTLNPLSHFDPVGLLCFVIIGFGWAKPVPVNPYNFKHKTRDSFFVASAGVISNYLLSFIIYPIFVLSCKLPQFGYFTLVLQFTLYYIFYLSLVFFVFNLIPVFPLDGFRIIDSFSKKRSIIYKFLRKYGIFVLYFLFFLGIIADYTGLYQLDILSNFINLIVGYINIPIISFWGLFL